MSTATIRNTILKIKDASGSWISVPSIKGDTGATGAQGPAATIAVGTTTTGSAGTQASVVNSGTSSAAVFDFIIPKGDTGPAFSGGYISTGWYENAVTLASGAIDLTLGNCFQLTVSSATTVTISNAQHCSVFTLVITNGGSSTVTWPSSIKWNDNTPPDLTTSGIDVIMFISPDGGTTFYGAQAVMGVTAS